MPGFSGLSNQSCERRRREEVIQHSDRVTVPSVDDHNRKQTRSAAGNQRSFRHHAFRCLAVKSRRLIPCEKRYGGNMPNRLPEILRARSFALLALPFVLGVKPASAEGYPTRPVTIIVPYAAGGATDILARILGDALSQKFGQPFIVENRPGAGPVSAPKD